MILMLEVEVRNQPCVSHEKKEKSQERVIVNQDSEYWHKKFNVGCIESLIFVTEGSKISVQSTPRP